MTRRYLLRVFFCAEVFFPPAEAKIPPIRFEVAKWFATDTTKLKMAANNRLKAARVLKGMTQLRLAELVGLKEIEISRIETGRTDADADLKRRIADVLGKPTFELFVG